jgi:hypothetical protein
MKKINIINHKNGKKFSMQIENPDSWIELNVKNNSWGKPERWVKKKILIDDNLGIFSYAEETYIDEDVIEEKSEEIFNSFQIDLNGEFILDEFGNKIPIIQNYVKLKSEYTINIVDISLSYYRKEKEKEILKAYEAKMNLITSKYPLSEREGWAVKKIQAEQWLASSDLEKTDLKTTLLMLVSESISNSNEDITILANAIIRDSNAYQVFYGTETKNKRMKLKALEESLTLEEINLIKY